MTNPTSNFGWQMPTSTDLVTDLPADFETFGQAVDTTLAELKGGTTGQILSKTSNTDMDFTWTTPNPGDITGVTAGTGISGGGTSGDVTVTNSMATTITTKGDLVPGTGSGTFARLAVGNNGETLVADSSSTTGLRWTATPSASNPVLNSAMQIWQRNTSFSIAASTALVYTADRWETTTGVNQACTVSRQATNDTTNLPNIQYALRFQRNSGQTGTAGILLTQTFETVNSIPYAGKTVTMSFYARAGANYSPTSSTLIPLMYSGTGTDQNILSGLTGSTNPINSSVTLTTTWQRFTVTSTAIPTNSTQIGVAFYYVPTGTAGAADYYEITGVQLDVGNTALPFRTNGGTIQGELAACQRYYYQTSGQFVTSSSQYTSTVCLLGLKLPVTMRTTPSYTAGTGAIFYNGSSQNPTFASNVASVDSYGLQGTTSAVTSGTAEYANLNNDHKFSAEL